MSSVGYDQGQWARGGQRRVFSRPVYAAHRRLADGWRQTRSPCGGAVQTRCSTCARLAPHPLFRTDPMRSSGLCLAMFTAAAAAGCASKPGQTTTPVPATRAATPSTRAVSMPRGRADLITEAEIAAAGGNLQTAFEIVQRLRPTMMRLRAGTTTGSSDGRSSTNVSSARIMVYLDNQPMGGIDALREIMTSQVREIRYLNANDATTLFGTGHQAGAIQVLGKKM